MCGHSPHRLASWTRFRRVNVGWRTRTAPPRRRPVPAGDGSNWAGYGPPWLSEKGRAERLLVYCARLTRSNPPSVAEVSSTLSDHTSQPRPHPSSPAFAGCGRPLPEGEAMDWSPLPLGEGWGEGGPPAASRANP